MKRLAPFFLVAFLSLTVHSAVLFKMQTGLLVKYSHAAELLLQGKLTGERILDFSPFYLQLNILLHKIGASSSTLLWIHILCTAMASGLFYLLLGRYCHPWITAAGTTAFILDRSLMTYTSIFEPETFLLLFIVAFTYFVTLQTNRSALISGIFFGLALLTRPNFLPVLLVVPVFFKLNSTGKVWRTKAIFFLVPALLFVAGLWLRNTHITGYFSPFVMNPGTVFYEGNNPNSWGMSSIYPPVLNRLSQQYSREPDYHHQLYRDFARKITKKHLSVPEVNSYWSQKAVKFLTEHPRRTLKLFGRKLLHIFHRYQWHDLAVAYSMERALQQGSIVNTPFALVSALALVGLLVFGREWRQYLIFYALFFTQLLTMLVIYVSARQRISVIFLFLFFACSAVQRMVDSRKTRWLLLLVLVLIFPLHLKTDLMNEEDHLWKSIQRSNIHLSEAYRLRNQGKLVEAAGRSALSLAFAPWFLDSRRPANLPFTDRYVNASLMVQTVESESREMDRALLLLAEDRPVEAEAIFRRLYQQGFSPKRDHYQSSELQFYLARCALQKNNRKEAISILQRAIVDSPGDPSSLAYLKALTGHIEYQQMLTRYFDEIDAAFYLGKSHFETGSPNEAVHYFQYVVNMLPEFRPAHLYLAAALSRSSIYDSAAEHYREAIRLNPDPVYFEQEILSTFEELAKRKDTAVDYYSYGVVLRQFGHFQAALEQQRKAISLGLNTEEIAREIKSLQNVIKDR